LGDEGDDDFYDDYDDQYDGDFRGVKVTSLSVSPEGPKLNLAIGGEVKLTATVVSDPPGAPVMWRSRKSSVATITDNGDGTATVRGVAGGTTEVKAVVGKESKVYTVSVAYTAGLYSGGGAKKEDDESFADGFNLTKAWTWIKDKGQTDQGDYLIVLGEDETSSATYNIGTGVQTGLNTGTKANLKITLRGTVATDDIDDNITISKTGNGALFEVYGNSSTDTPELILADITLKGGTNNMGLVVVGNTGKGKVTMKAGSRITENFADVANIGGGVHIKAGGLLAMEGGLIDKNKARASAGVHILASGAFSMTGGTIENNIAGTSTAAGQAGGVGVMGAFTMSGGVIQNNRSEKASGVIDGMTGGVTVGNGGVFTMKGTAVIRNNTGKLGGAVYLVSNANAQFIMEDGSIEGNTATSYGAAVFFLTNATVKKTGGTIYGVDNTQQNVKANGTSTVHAIVKASNATTVTKYYDDTAGPSLNGNLDSADVTDWSTP
jgi:hypothetical protein